MAGMSPLLQNSLGLKTPKQDKKQNLDNRHEKIYQDLQKRAHEAKPNEAKAVMVKEGILGNPITDTVDFFKDGANFFKTIKTGEMSDNNLGRINDFGLKIGAAIIATFLAAHSKTKKDTIMRFFGGAMFIAAMDLWPKLFINLPARLVHGFRIDRKYISAQGDKKDFFLDNQFLVWDAYPEEQLRKDAKNAGIDYDSENGKEKIQRKMQKTALQNRALWMATAGFATPLMTAMTCSAVEPYIEKALVEHDVKKVKNVLASEKGLENYLKAATQKAKPSTSELKEFDDIFEAYKNGKIPFKVQGSDNSLLGQLANKFSLARVFDSFKDSDDAKVMEKYSLGNTTDILEKMYEANKTIDKKAIEDGIDFVNRQLRADGFPEIDGAQQKTLFDSIGADFSIANVKKQLKELELNDEDIASILEKSKVDEVKFFEQVKNYYSTTFTQLKARVKAYLDLINPIVGSKAESLQTLEFNRTMKSTLKALGIDDKTIKEATKMLEDKNGVATGETSKIIEVLSKKLAGLTDKNYQKAIAALPAQGFDDKTKELIETIAKKENINLIGSDVSAVEGIDSGALTRAILGISDDTQGAMDIGNKDGLVSVFRKFIDYKGADIEAIKVKSILCANFERRLKGDLKDLTESEIAIARKILYDGTASTAQNRGWINNKTQYPALLEKLFNKEQFALEKQAVEGKIDIDRIVEDLKSIFGLKSAETPTKQYFECGSFTDHIKKYATSLGNNKAWKKIFIPMSIALVAITLLVQPLFGKIDKEFPDKGEGGAK